MKRTLIRLLLFLGAIAASIRTSSSSSSSSSTSTSSSSCHPDDKAALLAMKAAWGDPKQLASWAPDSSSSSCCDGDWHHVQCDDSTSTTTLMRRVTSLSIDDDGGGLVAGAIPDAIAGLTHLENLDLRRLPGLSGPIPPAIARLSKLAFLTISRTGISGPVPSFLGELTSLTELDLSYNSLSGSIPPSSLPCCNLWTIDLRHNRLTGSLPKLLFSNHPSTSINNRGEEEEEDDDEYNYLIDLRLSHNRLSGPIPPDWSTVRFGTVSLSRNALTGDPSAALFGRDKPLQMLDISRNAFSFNLSAVELPEDLGFMDLSHNDVYGGVPEQAANLQYLNVSYNRLCGELPTGPVPSFLGSLMKLQYVDLSRNGFSFNLSSTVAAMPDQLYFSHNAIYGGIPAQVANPTNLQFFNVSYNRLYGQIPAGDNMSRCDVFSFQHNKMQLPTVELTSSDDYDDREESGIEAGDRQPQAEAERRLDVSVVAPR
ncbi:hypothetical protein QOZ80_5BG0457200 [Eleusine coracana subsp. coracana]|nr:hypothetical protein QOZ80_5BG0457200 [Eleusine coracana subsp. coracana]